MSTIERVSSKDLRSLSPESVCEACGNLIQGHAWADMDDAGYVVACAISEPATAVVADTVTAACQECPREVSREYVPTYDMTPLDVIGFYARSEGWLVGLGCFVCPECRR